MSKVGEALRVLITELENDPRIVEYKKIKRLIAEDEYLQKSEARLKELQQLMTQNVFDKEKHAKLKEEYLTLKNDYENHPYILNYEALHAEITDLFCTLKNVIE